MLLYWSSFLEKNNADYTKHIFFVDDSLDNKRLDLVVSKLMPKYSRSHIQNWIKIGQIQVDEKTLKQKDKVYKGQIIKITTRKLSKNNRSGSTNRSERYIRRFRNNHNK